MPKPKKDLIDLYLQDQERRGLTPRTVSIRGRTLRRLERELGLDISRERLEQWLDDGNLSSQTRSVYLSHIGCFYRWAIETHRLKADPTEGIRPPKLRRKLPRPIPQADLDLALEHADAKRRALLLLGAYAGLRMQEIAGLRGEDVLVAEGVIRVSQAKGGHERLVPLHPDLLEALQAWGIPERGPVFTNLELRHHQPNGIGMIIGKHFRSLGIRSTPHALRHYFATRTLQQCNNVRTVQGLLGHQDLNSTMIYAAFDEGAAAAAVAGLGS